jgi:hypothetical protein
VEGGGPRAGGPRATEPGLPPGNGVPQPGAVLLCHCRQSPLFDFLRAVLVSVLAGACGSGDGAGADWGWGLGAGGWGLGAKERRNEPTENRAALPLPIAITSRGLSGGRPGTGGGMAHGP